MQIGKRPVNSPLPSPKPIALITPPQSPLRRLVKRANDLIQNANSCDSLSSPGHSKSVSTTSLTSPLKPMLSSSNSRTRYFSFNDPLTCSRRRLILLDASLLSLTLHRFAIARSRKPILEHFFPAGCLPLDSTIPVDSVSLSLSASGGLDDTESCHSAILSVEVITGERLRILLVFQYFQYPEFHLSLSII